MARIAFSLHMVASRFGAERILSQGSAADVVPASGFAADKTAFEATLATLVSDGASPTQAHVTAANNAYTTFKNDLGAAPPASPDLVVSIDTAIIPTKQALRIALDAIFAQVGAALP